ncbi:MAG: 50S ribosomal protein L24 [Gemmatimonadaceae bacterium]|nr:50S ribosomal protein L24 [Gemmatimonadaceae bacterium]
MNVKKDDTVLIICGNDKGRRGRVLRVLPEKDRVIVEGVRMMKKHTKPTQRDPQGGIVEREASIHISNVMVVDPKTDAPTRVRRRALDDGRSVRVAARSGEMIDSQ